MEPARRNFLRGIRISRSLGCFIWYVFRSILTSCNIHIPYERPLERMKFWTRGRANGIWYIFLWWIHCLIVCTVQISVQNQPASSRNHSFHWKRLIKDIVSASVIFPLCLLTVVDSRCTLHIIRFIRDRWNAFSIANYIISKKGVRSSCRYCIQNLHAFDYRPALGSCTRLTMPVHPCRYAGAKRRQVLCD
jgi:hypothetical protein